MARGWDNSAVKWVWGLLRKRLGGLGFMPSGMRDRRHAAAAALRLACPARCTWGVTEACAMLRSDGMPWSEWCESVVMSKMDSNMGGRSREHKTA